jgi:hypothetical protein
MLCILVGGGLVVANCVIVSSIPMQFTEPSPHRYQPSCLNLRLGGVSECAGVAFGEKGAVLLSISARERIFFDLMLINNQLS